MKSIVLLALIGITLLALCGCANIERKREIEDLRNALEVAKTQGADPAVIADLEARIEDLEDEESGASIIDTGNDIVNKGIEYALLAIFGYFGINFYRGTPKRRKGLPPTNGTTT